VPEGIRGFLVPAGAEGFRTVDVHDKLSLVASTTSELILEDCRLPAEAMLPGATSLGAPLACLNEARYGIVWGAVGAARACLDAALEYTATRTSFGAPLATRQMVQQELVEMHVAVSNGHLIAQRIGALKDSGRVAPEHISYGKFNNVRMATDVARRARALLGANGITLEYPVMRHLVNLESVLTYEGTHQIHTLVLGRALTGHAAFSA
jgi:glutaryl-CoA dehydrogenase